MKNIFKLVLSILNPLSQLILIILFLVETIVKKHTEINYSEWICILLIFIMTNQSRFLDKKD